LRQRFEGVACRCANFHYPSAPTPAIHLFTQGQFQLLSRELAYYLNPDNGERLSLWLNPLNNASVDVVHVSNDPVNNPVYGPLPVANAAGSTQVT
jgi:hypothetical protein